MYAQCVSRGSVEGFTRHNYINVHSFIHSAMAYPVTVEVGGRMS